MRHPTLVRVYVCALLLVSGMAVLSATSLQADPPVPGKTEGAGGAAEPATPTVPARLPLLRFVPGKQGGTAIYGTPAGPLRMACVEEDPGDLTPDADLSAAILRALAASVESTEAAPWHYEASPIWGGHLTSADQEILVLPFAVLRRAEVAPTPRKAERVAVTEAAERLIAGLGEQAHVSEALRAALSYVLGRLDDVDHAKQPLDELMASYARQIVAAGWLSELIGEERGAARRALENAVRSSIRPRVGRTYTGYGVRWERVEDAWGRGAWAFRAPDRMVLTAPPLAPLFDRGRLKNYGNSRLVVELPLGSDPAEDPGCVARATSAVLWRNGDELASWRPGQGLRADEALWRKTFPSGKGRIVKRRFPPHIALAGLDGIVYGLALPRGLLRAVRSESESEAERFLNEAADLLPDAAHLDLLHEYLFTYVYDSPDPTVPRGIGSRDVHGDIHQTARETLATSVGGVSRGDCDDFAELCRDIARRQGRLAHVIGVPGHAAAAWADRTGKVWRVFVLQTGPPLEIRHAELPIALERAYGALDRAAPFDRDSLRLKLRFTGQNTRANWYLPWRVFADPKFAEAMIGVQEDWHYMTLLQGVQTMRALIAAGDDHAGNHRELTELYRATGRYEEAIEGHRATIERTGDAETRRYRYPALIQDLLRVGRRDEALSLITEVLGAPSEGEPAPIGLKTLALAHSLVGILVAEDEPLEAARILNQTSARRLEGSKRKSRLLDFLQPSAAMKLVGPRSGQRIMRRLLRDYALYGISILERVDAESRAENEDVKALARRVLRWLRHLALADTEVKGDVVWRWAAYGRYQGAGKGEAYLDQVAAAAMPPTSDGIDFVNLVREGDEATLLSWVRASPVLATHHLSVAIADETKTLDPALLERLRGLIENASDATRRLGLDTPALALTVDRARLQLALLGQDEGAVRALLRRTKHLDDRRTHERTALALGDCAPHVDPEWWRHVVVCWVEELDYKPTYFWVAWRAAIRGAKIQALHMADVAAERFADDEAFVAEARYMHELLGE